MADIIKFNGKKESELSVEDIIEWVRAQEADGNINKLSLIIESSDKKINSRSINLLNKDYIYFLMNEMFVHFNGGE